MNSRVSSTALSVVFKFHVYREFSYTYTHTYNVSSDTTMRKIVNGVAVKLVLEMRSAAFLYGIFHLELYSSIRFRVRCTIVYVRGTYR